MTDKEKREVQELLKELEIDIKEQEKRTMHLIDIIEKILEIKDKIIKKQEDKIKQQKQNIAFLREELEPYILKDNPNISVPNAYGIGMENYKDKELKEIEKLKEECNAIFEKELFYDSSRDNYIMREHSNNNTRNTHID